MALRVSFSGSSGANLFMEELLDVLCAAVEEHGVSAERVTDGFADAHPDVVHVAIPHEFHATVPADRHPTAAQLAQTIALCTEQPGTTWFDRTVAHADRAGAALDISRVGVVALRAAGVAAEHLQLGWAPALDGWGGEDHAPRDVELLYMGSANRRREVVLSGYADALAGREAARLMIPPHHVKTTERPDFVVGEGKRSLLARTQVLLAVRRQETRYFEWARALDAICNGAVLVIEHGAGHTPLVPGEHFVSGSAAALGELADALVADPGRQETIRQAAYAFVRERLRLVDGVAVLLATAERLRGAAGRPRPRPLPPPPAADPSPPDAATVDAVVAGGLEEKLARLGEIKEQRQEAARALTAAGIDPTELDTVHRSPAYDRLTRPGVTVCVPAYRAAEVIGAAVASVAAQDLAEVELIVHDDASDDGTAEAATAAVTTYPGLAALVVRRRVNAGLPTGRNTMAHLSRAPYVLMLDADNELLVPAARRLAAALDADPGAAFAYPVLACHLDGEPDGLLSTLPWDPALLRHYNPIDALALLRRDHLLELGGYTTEAALHGWEDYELWCRIAERGGRGVQVPQMLARYRRSSGGSMLSLTDLDTAHMRARLRELHPRTLA